MNSRKIFSVIIPLLLFCAVANAQVRITEFMASNSSTLVDEDGDTSDWIEIQNTSATNVNLLNWSLTDKAGKPAKWRFPAENIAPQSFMIVFASGKDRTVPGAPLHTNFKLGGDGDYLALVRPDGSSATEISPEYPAQFPDVSYGVGMRVVFTTLVSSNAPLRFRIPSDASEDATWTQLGFSDATWQSGFNGIGYDSEIPDPLETSFAANVLRTSPTAYWRLNETNGTDAANIGSDGSGFVGGYLGNVILGKPGPRAPQINGMDSNNFAPLFNGTDSYVNGPYQLLSDLTAFTIGGWIRPTAAQQSHAGLFGQNDVVEFGFNTPSTIQVWTPLGAATFSYPYPKNEWHYVTATGDSTNEIALYLDGNKVAGKTVSGATFGNSEYFFKMGGGGIFAPDGNWFLGQLDEVAVWQRALSANEIADLVSTNSGQVSYAPFLNTDLQSQMYRSNATAYIRIPFTVSNPASVIGLKLLLRYDDGFAAYINGHEIFQTNAPDSLAWNSTATARNPDASAAQWREFDVSDARNWLQSGDNVLAIHGLNISADNTDFLIQAQLVAENLSESETPWRYLTDPTPGGPNGINAADYGPSLFGAGHFPEIPQSGDFLTVTANVARAFSPISNVTLKYRVMFGGEISVPMNDSGTNGDASPNDGTWTGIIPANVAAAGQMIRYYITATDSDGNISRWPIFKNTDKSQQYLGTVAADPVVQSALPVAYLFIQNPGAADTQNGTQASLFYLNEFYDNINISIHGQSSTTWIKKSHNIDFPKDHAFLYKPGGERQSDVIFLSNYGDKARMRTTLTYEIAAESGGVSFFSFPIRIQLNGAFWGIEDMVEHGDETFLSRVGRDPNGALYKMYNALTSASGNEKKTREWEDSSDLSSLILNLDESRPLSARVAYGYDHLDLPQTANYFATMALVSSQDFGHKNYYLYHDNDGTGEWAIFPWDVDLTWGRNWTDSQGYFTDNVYTNNVLS
ncbi:MAG TPA: CotH kinase family protein, partial [Verrucomicrobiae bacterium]|nr:CotH kinase family protein [Verrucomicrobiae bacterium]